jgi:hypothetical protein
MNIASAASFYSFQLPSSITVGNIDGPPACDFSRYTMSLTSHSADLDEWRVLKDDQPWATCNGCIVRIENPFILLRSFCLVCFNLIRFRFACLCERCFCLQYITMGYMLKKFHLWLTL